MALTAFSCMSGSTWAHVSIVMEMFACPSISCTILECVPLDSRSVAHKFVNSGAGRLRQVDIHASDHFVTEWLE